MSDITDSRVIEALGKQYFLQSKIIINYGLYRARIQNRLLNFNQKWLKLDN